MKSKLSKIFTSTLIAASLLCGAVSGKDSVGAMFSAVAFAASDSGECGTNAIWNFDAGAGILTISGTGSVTGYSDAADAPWHSCKADIRSIVIEEGITGVGKLAFACCDSAICLTLPSTLTTFGTGAFNGCTNLSHINIPTGKTASAYIGRGSLPADTSIYCTAYTDSECEICKVINLIEAIGTVTRESRAAISEARSAYDALSAEYKRFVTNYSILCKAEILAYYIPQNVEATVLGKEVAVSWNEVEGASEYKIVDENLGIISENITDNSYSFTARAPMIYNLSVYAYVNGEWGRPSNSVEVTVKSNVMSVMSSGITATGYSTVNSTIGNGEYNMPLYFGNEYTVIGGEDYHLQINNDLTCTGTLRLVLNNTAPKSSVPLTWVIGNNLELDTYNNSLSIDLKGNTSQPGKLIIGGDLIASDVNTDSSFAIVGNTDVFVQGDVYIKNGIQINIGGRLFVKGNVYLTDPTIYEWGNPCLVNWNVNTSNFFVGGKVWDSKNNVDAAKSYYVEDYKFSTFVGALDVTSSDWINAWSTLDGRMNSPAYERLPVIDNEESTPHVTLLYNNDYRDADYKGKTIAGVTMINEELTIDKYPDGVIIDDLIDVAEYNRDNNIKVPGSNDEYSPGHKNIYCTVIDTGEDPNAVFKIQIKPNHDYDGDGKNETFTWLPLKDSAYKSDASKKPYVLIKGRGTLAIEVSEGTTYQAAHQEGFMHINWYTMLGGKINRIGSQCWVDRIDTVDCISTASKNGWIHTTGNCTGNVKCEIIQKTETDNNGEPVQIHYCAAHDRKVNLLETSANDCCCSGVIEKSQIDSWISENLSSKSTEQIAAFTDSNGDTIYPNVNTILVSNDESAQIRLSYFEDGIAVAQNTFWGWIYAPYMTYMAKPGSGGSGGTRILGGIIVSSYISDDWYIYTYCRPNESVINLIETCAIAEPTANTAGYGLDFKDGTGLTFWMDLSHDIVKDTSTQMIFKLGGKTIAIPVADAVPDVITNKRVYGFTCPVAAAEMADEIHAQIVSDSYESEIFTYSIQQYVSENFAGFRENVHEISEYIDYNAIAAMLNYGAAAQKYFGHNADNPANNALDECDRGVPDIDARTLSGYKLQIKDDRKSGLFVGQAITLNNRVTIKLYFKGALTANDFAVTCEDGTVDSSCLSVTNDSSRIILAINEIAPGDFGKSFTVTVGDVVISDISVFSYAEQVLSRGITELYDIAAALVYYNDCVIEAKQYAMQTDEIISA